jgi:DNA-binding NarL/FixJ family response regulator
MTAATAVPKTRIVIADERPLLRFGVRAQVEDAGFDVCAEAADGASAVEDALRTHPDLCLLGASMAGAIEAASEIRRRLPDTKVVLFTGCTDNDEDEYLAALFSGASGFLSDDVDPARLPHVLRAVLRGEVVVPRALVGSLVERLRSGPESRGACVQRSRRSRS